MTPKMMKAVVTTGNGGYERLEYKDVPVPELKEGEVLLKVLAAGINNTEINTRLGLVFIIGDGIDQCDF